MSCIQMNAGPNGSGKSTITSEVKPVGMYINADEIQAYLKCSSLEAAENARELREYCLANGLDFTMETVFSTPEKVELLQRAKSLGYYIICLFVLTRHPDINVRRVADRVKRGGHDVPEEKVRKRYVRSLNQLAALPELCDELYVFDNSLPREAGGASLIVRCVHGDMTLYCSAEWNEEMLKALMAGRYCSDYLNQDAEM